MELKDRKLIANGALPKYKFGTRAVNSAISGLDTNLLGNIAAGNNATSISSLTSGNGGVPVVTLSGSQEVKPMNALGNNSVAGFFEHSGSKQNPAVTAATKNPNAAGQFLKNNAQGIANAAMSALNFASTIGGLSKNTMTADEMMGSGGQFENSANGISYQESRIDQGAIQDQINATASAATMGGVTSGASLGGSLGSLFGPLGTGIGTVAGGIIGGVAGLLGGKSAKREAERLKEIAINRTNAMNALNRETAYTIGLRNEFNRENRTDTSLSLFHAALGVEDIENDVNPITRRTKHKHLVDTAEHGVVPGFGNSFGSEGEQMISGKKDKNGMHKVHGIKRGPNDTALMDLKPRDSVMSRLHVDWETGLPIADAVALNAKMHGGKISAEDKTRYEMNLNVERMMLYSGKRKGNILPGYLGGTNKIWDTVKSIGQNLDLGNIATTIGAYTTAAQRDAQAEGGIRAPKSFVANPYENAALDELNKLHSDYYTVWAGNREAEGRAKSAIAQSGGLSGGQRMLAYMGMLNQTLQNNANAMFYSQKLNNEYAGQAAKIKLATGENSATRQAEAYRWDEDMLAKAHAARLNMWETSAYDRQNALESFFHNRFKKQQFDRTMNLYESQQKNDEAKTKAIIDSLNNKSTRPIYTTGTNTANSTKTDVANTALDAAKRATDGAPEKPADVEPLTPKWDGQYLSRRRKSRGENVANLQRNLAKALGQKRISEIMAKNGMKPGSKWDDGKFGNATHDALWEFQTSRGWTKGKGLDGVLGENTFNALQAAIKPKK